MSCRYQDFSHELDEIQRTFAESMRKMNAEILAEWELIYLNKAKEVIKLRLNIIKDLRTKFLEKNRQSLEEFRSLVEGNRKQLSLRGIEVTDEAGKLSIEQYESELADEVYSLISVAIMKASTLDPFKSFASSAMSEFSKQHSETLFKIHHVNKRKNRIFLSSLESTTVTDETKYEKFLQYKLELQRELNKYYETQLKENASKIIEIESIDLYTIDATALDGKNYNEYFFSGKAPPICCVL